MKPIHVLAAAAAVALPMVLSPAARASGIDNQMEQLFGSMSNTTPAGAFETARRGGFTGGRITVKNRIMDTNLVSFSPPSFEAGCGGIDLFGGSFSFINADQFVQLLRNVAASASGYAFYLALDAMAPDVAQTIETLQKKVQQLNGMFSNSCQLAQGLVNDTLSAFDVKEQSKASTDATLSGVGDVFTTWTKTSGKSPKQSLADNDPAKAAKELKGNLMWRALKKNGVQSWFSSGIDSGDDATLEFMMSLTGSVIVGDLQDAGDGTGEGVPLVTSLASMVSSLGVRTLIEGTAAGQSVEVYQCDGHGEDECLSPTTGNTTIVGFRQRLDTLILGAGGAGGLIDKLRTGATLTPAEKALLGNMRGSAGSLLVQLTKYSPEGARQFAQVAMPLIAYQMADIVLGDLFQAADVASNTLKDSRAGQLKQQIATARRLLSDDYLKAGNEIAKPNDVIPFYRAIIDAHRKAPNLASYRSPATGKM